MVTQDDQTIDEEERQDDFVQERPHKAKPKNKRRVLGCGLLSLFLLLVLFGVLIGLHLLGVVDLLPIIYKTGSHLPLIGERFSSSSHAVLTPEERRRQELEEHEKYINQKFLDLQAKEEELIKKEQELARKESELIAKIEELTKSVEAETSAKDVEIERESFSKLVSILQEMPTRRAAEVLNDLSDSLAIEVLEALSPDVAGKILGRMDVAKATALMEQLAAKEK
jgi:flagellar motility protein MotE (MotC chaperone)